MIWPGKHFSFAEFHQASSPKFHGYNPDGMARAARLVPMLDDVRAIAGEPMRITSWWRPNQERNGPHKHGFAVDFCLVKWTQEKHDRLLTHLPGLLSTERWASVDQCIWYELSAGGHIHIGLRWAGGEPRGQLLRASRGEDRTVRYRSVR